MKYLRRMSRRCCDSLVVVKHNIHKIPVAIAEVPEDPVRRVRVYDQRQDAEVDDQHYRTGESNHQTHKHLHKKGEERIRSTRSFNGCFLFTIL